MSLNYWDIFDFLCLLVVDKGILNNEPTLYDCLPVSKGWSLFD